MNRPRVAFVALVPLLASSVAGAVEGGGDHHAEIANMWGLGAAFSKAPALGFVTITFLVFIGALIYILRPRIQSLLEARSHAVRAGIEEAQRAKAAAEARARDAEEKLASLGSEMDRLKADFEQQGQAELARIEKLAQETAARIAKDAEDTIAAEAQRARQQLQVEASRLALELAEERIKAALSTADDARLQQALIAGLADAPPRPQA